MTTSLQLEKFPYHVRRWANKAAKSTGLSVEAIIMAALYVAVKKDKDSDEGYSNIGIDSQIDQDNQDDQEDYPVTASSVGEEDVRMADINSLQI